MPSTANCSPATQTVLDALRARRTIHDFLADVPPREAVLAAIDAARWAPNHRLTEPWRFYLLGAETAERISLLNAALVSRKSGEEAAAAKLRRWRAMPGWLAVTCAKSADAPREQEDYAACCCAVQNLLLGLWAAGIGSKWSTGKVIREAGFLEAIGADASQEFCVGLVWYGYPQTVPAQQRVPLTQLLHERP